MTLREAAEAWKQSFAGGMIAFDLAYGRVRDTPGTVIADAQKAGVDATLDAFVDFVERNDGTIRVGQMETDPDRRTVRHLRWPA